MCRLENPSPISFFDLEVFHELKKIKRFRSLQRHGDLEVSQE